MAKQVFRFAELYKRNRAAVVRTLTSMWCGQQRNESQKAYARQLREIIENIFTPENAIPLVQCMNDYKSVYSVSVSEAEAIVGELWQKSMPSGMHWDPYEHQYRAWKALLRDTSANGEHQSIVVTTGTGSGKTECFMMPLVRDLLDNPKPGVRAIFLYPLNALMEDQKERLEKLLKDTDLFYAVYNSSLPEKEVPITDPDYEKVRRRIDAIKGIERNDKGEIIKTDFPHAIGTREEMRKNPPAILLTNPTMLEYMLLRGEDQELITPGSLAWMAIDETHTYTGAGATELAMLIRRIKMAFNVVPGKLRFATSSATIAGDSPEAILELRRFIADLTGQPLQQIVHIDGERKGIENVPDDEDKEYWLRLINHNKDGYLPLNELFNDGKTIIEQLEHLDRMCQTIENKEIKDIRAKVHYFYHVPNRGLYVDISQCRDGSFVVDTRNRISDGGPSATPMLELSRCNNCGEFLAIAEADFNDNTFGPIMPDEQDMFDLEEPENSRKRYIVFGQNNNKIERGDNNVMFSIEGNHFSESLKSVESYNAWRLVGNTQCSCPNCGTKLTKNQTAAGLDTEDEELSDKKLRRFRLGADFISRVIAPSTLDLMTKVVGNPEEESFLLHDGQQYISFVDSRQTASQSTIKQNLDEERLWVYSMIFHKLCEKATTPITQEEAQDIYTQKLRTTVGTPAFNEILSALQRLQSPDEEVRRQQIAELQKELGPTHLTWEKVYDLLWTDKKNLDKYCYQFAERSEYSIELDDKGEITDDTRRKYLLSVMVDLLAKRPRTGASPETMGLFTPYYEKLQGVWSEPLPTHVEHFNSLLSDDLKIGITDWHDLLQIYVDYDVRSNQSVYLKMRDDDEMDIFKCIRFATKKEKRRSVHKPEVAEKGPKRVLRLLANLISQEKKIKLKDAIDNYAVELQGVLDDMWAYLTNHELITLSTHYNKKSGRHEIDNDWEDENGTTYPPYRLNFKDVSFCLYDNAYLCDVNGRKDRIPGQDEILLPVPNLFKGYSPYLKNGHVLKVPHEMQEKWTIYPYGFFGSSPLESVSQLNSWAKENRKLLWDNGLWGETGLFSQRLETIYSFPNLFVQAEHTAQVDKMISKKVQKDFRKHRINILACSTTMEMGVNLGDLELVMLTSVPPQPANYKQRAGRSGRREQVRSACVTLCGSDAVGMRTMQNPLVNLILRTSRTPWVDLSNAEVIQRHVNAFLIRESGVFNRNGGNIMQKTVDYFTNFEIADDGGGHLFVQDKVTQHRVEPDAELGNQDGSAYEEFNEFCSAIPTETVAKLQRLLFNTVFDGKCIQVVNKARSVNEECNKELLKRMEAIKEGFVDAKSNPQKNFFRFKYLEPLSQQLLSFWATHRFTPNANMPVDVIEFDINSTNTDYYSKATPSNPSYPLRTALAQYAPGNPIARDGSVRIVRGLRYTDFFKKVVTFKKLYHNNECVVVDRKSAIEEPKSWKVSGSQELELIQPSEFIPDMNESANRILDNKVYTTVDAQLVETTPWSDVVTEPHLFETRSSKENANARVLYYNQGIGFGYCHCTKCGKTVLERWAASSSSDPDLLPYDMNDVEPNDPDRPMYHFSLVKSKDKAVRCMGCNDPSYIRRNVVIGDMIQTDFTEIRIRHTNNGWIASRSNELGLLTTLSIVLTQSLAELLNIERDDIDFTITPNGHICIYDTNPGGSGYASQLAEMDLMKNALAKAYDILRSAKETKAKEALVDRNTQQYINKLDIDKALAWIEEEVAAQNVLPSEIADIFPNATETSLLQLQRNFEKNIGDATLFFDATYSHWDYDDTDLGWKGRLMHKFVSRGQYTNVCIYGESSNPVIEPIKDVIRSIKGWAKSAQRISKPFNDIFPLAYIDGYLYFTNNPECSSLNGKWSAGTVYYTYAPEFKVEGEVFDTTIPVNTTCIFKLEGSENRNIKSNELGAIIHANSQSLVEDFIAHCKSNPNETVSVIYQDEHMKSVLSIVLALQTINYFLHEIGNEFTLQFMIEEYDAPNGRADSIRANQPDSDRRDNWLKSLSNQWIEDLEGEGLYGEIEPIESLPKNSLTHWRVLSFECAGKKISIYPDGGFMNGWGMDRHDHSYDTSNITHDSDVSLFRTQDIKFDIQITEE